MSGPEPPAMDPQRADALADLIAPKQTAERRRAATALLRQLSSPTNQQTG